MAVTPSGTIVTRAPITVKPEPWPASQTSAPTRMPSRGAPCTPASVANQPMMPTAISTTRGRARRARRRASRSAPAGAAGQHRPGRGPVGSGATSWPSHHHPAPPGITLPRRRAPGVGGSCAPCVALPYRGTVMRSPETFDAYYVETRTRLLHEAFALTGDAPAARAAVRDAFVVAWHHWRKVDALEDRDSYVRPLTFRRAAPPAHRPHLAPRQVARPRGAHHARRAVQALHAPARAPRAQRRCPRSPSPTSPAGGPPPRRRRARAADRRLAVLPAPRRARPRRWAGCCRTSPSRSRRPAGPARASSAAPARPAVVRTP